MCLQQIGRAAAACSGRYIALLLVLIYLLAVLAVHDSKVGFLEQDIAVRGAGYAY